MMLRSATYEMVRNTIGRGVLEWLRVIAGVCRRVCAEHQQR